MQSLVAESESTDPLHPTIAGRYAYLPYGEAHVESAPELLRAHIDGDVASVTGTPQAIADPRLAAPGALLLDWSAALDATTLAAGVVLEAQVGGVWTALTGTDVAIALDNSATKLTILPIHGWTASTSYRVRLTPSLHDTLGRALAANETVELRTAAAPATGAMPTPPFDRRTTRTYESWRAANDTLGNRFPGGQSHLFQGAWTDPVTGMAYHRARWYEPRTAHWLSEDPAGTVDSVNLQAFVGWGPQGATDPKGESLLCLWKPALCVGAAVSAWDTVKGLATLPARLMEADRQVWAKKMAARNYSEYQRISTEEGKKIDAAIGEALVDAIPGRGSGRASGEAVEACQNGGDFECGYKSFSAGFRLFGDFFVAGGASQRFTAVAKGGAEVGGFSNGFRAPAALASPSAEASIDALVSSRGTLGITGGAYRTAQLGQGSDGILYLLRDSDTGRILKIGKTEADTFLGRFQKYEAASRYSGLKLEAEIFDVKKTGSFTTETAERALRSFHELMGETLPWDNTASRLGRPGPGVPGTHLPRPLREQGYAWEGNELVKR